LSRNKISNLSPVYSQFSLKHLDLGVNQIETVPNLRRIGIIRKLVLHGNSIKNVGELRKVKVGILHVDWFLIKDSPGLLDKLRVGTLNLCVLGRENKNFPKTLIDLRKEGNKFIKKAESAGIRLFPHQYGRKEN